MHYYNNKYRRRRTRINNIIKIILIYLFIYVLYEKNIINNIYVNVNFVSGLNINIRKMTNDIIIHMYKKIIIMFYD